MAEVPKWRKNHLFTISLGVVHGTARRTRHCLPKPVFEAINLWWGIKGDTRCVDRQSLYTPFTITIHDYLLSTNNDHEELRFGEFKELLRKIDGCCRNKYRVEQKKWS